LSSVWKESVVSESKFWQGGETRGEAMRGNARVKEEEEGIKRAPYPKNLFLSLSLCFVVIGKKRAWEKIEVGKSSRSRQEKSGISASLFERDEGQGWEETC